MFKNAQPLSLQNNQFCSIFLFFPFETSHTTLLDTLQIYAQRTPRKVFKYKETYLGTCGRKVDMVSSDPHLLVFTALWNSLPLSSF